MISWKKCTVFQILFSSILVINFVCVVFWEVQNVCTCQMMLSNMQIMSDIYIDKPVLLHLFKHTVLLVLHLSNFDDELLYALKQWFINSEKIYIVLFIFFLLKRASVKNYSLPMAVYNNWFHYLKNYHLCTIHLILI